MWLSSSTPLEDVLDQLQLMSRLEQTSYARRDYLHSSDHDDNNIDIKDNNKDCSNSSSSLSSSLFNDAMYVLGGPISPSSCRIQQSSPTEIHKQRRHQMVDLMYEIADYCHFRRETVAYATYNIMDRYSSVVQQRSTTNNNIIHNNNAPIETAADLQLVASASMYIAVKVLEPVSLDIHSLAELSRGAFTSNDILDMERTILLSLKWNVALGPTSIFFVRHFLTLLRLDDDDEDSKHTGNRSSKIILWNELLNHAQYQVELAVTEYNVGAKHQLSDIALAAVWNALESQLEPSQARHYQCRLWSYLPRAGFNVELYGNYLAQIQFVLCKLQYTAQEQEPSCYKQPTDDAATKDDDVTTWSDTDSTTPSSSSSEDECDYSADGERYWMGDGTERTEDAEFSPVILGPSPISIMTNHFFSSDTTKKVSPVNRKKKQAATILAASLTSKENAAVLLPAKQENKDSCSSLSLGISFVRQFFSVAMSA